MQNLAAGVASPITQEMILNAQNPSKNKFIRKPMSPVLGSLFTSPKMTKKDQSK